MALKLKIFAFLLMIFAIGQIFATNDKLELTMTEEEKQIWYKEDPDFSGIPDCRRCTMEYRKLNQWEQAYWTLMKDWNTTAELMDGIQRLFIVSGRGFLPITSAHQVINDYIQQEAEYLNKLPVEGKELLYNYFVHQKLAQEQINEKLNNLYMELSVTKAWQQYELDLKNEKTDDDAAADVRTHQRQMQQPIIPTNFTRFGDEL